MMQRSLPVPQYGRPWLFEGIVGVFGEEEGDIPYALIQRASAIENIKCYRFNVGQLAIG